MSDLGGLRRAFRDGAGREPDGLWSSPGRVNLVGEHTDYNEGLVLPAAVDLRTTVAVGLRSDRLLRCRSLDLPGTAEVDLRDLQPGAVRGWAGYVAGVLWALQERGVPVPGLDVVVGSRVPVGAGLSSSAALQTAIALAVVDLTGTPLDRTGLALAAQRAEVAFVGAPVGVMDQVAAMHGRRDSAVLLDCRSLQVQSVPLRLREAGLQLVVVDTRVAHAHATGGYRERRAQCERAAGLLGVPALRDATLDDVEERLDGALRRRARHVVSEGGRVCEVVRALAERDEKELGRLFAASHASLRDDFEVSCVELDLAVETAGEAGAVAARMTGGGFGGCVVALVPEDLCDQVETRTRRAFTDRGLAAPRVLQVVPDDGARREDAP